MYAVSDGAHHGNPDFFFLSPLFKNPNTDPNFEPNAFNGLLQPSVTICELGDPLPSPPAPPNTRECAALTKQFPPSAVSVSLTAQQYQVDWNTTESALNVTKFYRIQVLVGTTLLGFADVDPVANASQLKNVQTGENIGLVNGRTLPIKFRIESGALCGTDGTPCAAKTINLTQGGGVELIVPGEDFHFDIPAGTQATTPGGQVVTDVTFNLELCAGIDVDLPKYGQCLRVTALYDASGTALHFSNPILVSMCSFVPVTEGQRELITLHQQDGDLIRALPHAHPNCNVIGSRTSVWSRVRDFAAALFTPRTLYASTRTTMLHLGGGGETDRTGATCTSSPSAPIGMALGTCTPPPSAQATPVPTAGHTISDFQFALPAMMDYVDPADARRTAPPGALSTAVKVTDWNNQAVQGATVTFTQVGEPNILVGTATSNADGIAEVSWNIAAGLNNLVASGRGIAAQNNYPNGTVRPFMPDIFSTNPEVAVVVGDGAVPFVATGAALADLTIHDLSISPIEPAAGPITISGVVSNSGGVAAGPSTVSLCAMQFTLNGAGGSCDVFVGPSVPAGGSVPVSTTLGGFGGLSPGAYTVTASVDTFDVVPESNETNNKAVGPTFGVGTITFESYPDGSPTCGDCKVGSEFAARGVTFSFSRTLPNDTVPHICNSTPNDPAPILIPALLNHGVTAPAVGDPCNGWLDGTMTMTLAPQPDTVEFRLRGPDPGSPSAFFPITAFDGNGAALPAGAVIHTIVGTYTPAGPGANGTRREELVTVVGAGAKISRIVVDENTSIKFLDNLRIVVLGP